MFGRNDRTALDPKISIYEGYEKIRDIKDIKDVKECEVFQREFFECVDHLPVLDCRKLFMTPYFDCLKQFQK